MRLLGEDEVSEAWDYPARDDLDFPLILERSKPRDAAGLALFEERARTLAALPSPFRRIVELRPHPRALELLQERFLGVTGREFYYALKRHQRLVPIDVWLGIAERLCSAASVLPLTGPARHLVISPSRFGADVRRQFLVFPHTHRSLSFESRGDHPYYGSPEWRDGAPIDARSRVFSLAATLVLFLTGDNPVRRQLTLGPDSTDAAWDPAVHPACTPALAAVLSGAMNDDPAARPATPQALLEQLITTVGCKPAPTERVVLTMLGAAPERWQFLLSAVRDTPELLPRAWRGGGLAVLEDQLLEAMIPADQLERREAPLSQLPDPLASPPLGAPPTRRPWWQSLWPFKR